MAEEAKSKDKWDKWETVSKIVGGVSIPVIGLILTFALHQQATNAQKGQLYASILTGREKADSDVRAQMFSHLLARFLKPPETQTDALKDLQDRIMFLDLLRENFQEYFNAKPLFTRLYEEISEKERQATSRSAKAQWAGLKQQLIDIAQDMTSAQVASLARIGNLVEDIFVPLTGDIDVQPEKAPRPQEQGGPLDQTGGVRIALYPTQGLNGLEEAGIFNPTKDQPKSAVAATSGRSAAGDRYSITIKVKKIDEKSANLSITLHRDAYNGNRFDSGSSGRALGLKPIEFNVSYFATPYMDNTRLFDGSRFSVLYRACVDYEEEDQACRFPVKKGRRPLAQLDVVTFGEEFLSQRDRPYVDQILKQIGTGNSWWWPF